MTDYRVGVELAMSGNLAQALGAITANMGNMLGLQGKLTRGFQAWRPAILGAVAAFAGFESLKGLFHIAQASKDLLNQQDQLARSGLKLNDILRIQGNFYEKISKTVPTASAADFLKSVGEMRAITGPGSEALDEASRLATKALMVDTLRTGRRRPFALELDRRPVWRE